MAIITVRYDKSIKNWGEDESVFINWGYEPKILEDVKALKFRWWHPELKEWEITRNGLKELDKKYGGSIRGIREEDKAFSGIKYGLIEESEIPAGYEFKTKLMPHQLTFVKKGLSVDSIINGNKNSLVAFIYDDSSKLFLTTLNDFVSVNKFINIGNLLFNN